jgi:ADP-ribose pyrophosphatase YjhB (NUDIX family)
LADDALALMMRDELMNRRMQHQEWYRWAVPDTVARMRRTLFLQVERERRKQTALK